ncbi:ATP-binding protein [Streptomyces sp. NPDC127061]|uniref:ATP-binding protein n=1 Tax=unclassified Streptomyces TaxID=2593676 RepID=UPI00362A13BF
MFGMADEEDHDPQSPPPAVGHCVRYRSRGFAAHINASGPNLRSVRELTAKALAELGVQGDVADAAQLVVSELVGNAVRACGDHVPVVVEVYAAAFGVAVNVHDPDPRTVPRRRGIALDDVEAEAVRGLALLDLLAPGRHVVRSSIGKQIRCRVPCPAG